MAMTTIAEQPCRVTAGIDTPADVNVAVVLDDRGRLLGTEPFEGLRWGHGRLEALASRFGSIDTIAGIHV